MTKPPADRFPSEAEQAAAEAKFRRAGPNRYSWSGLSFTIIENTLRLGDLDEVVENIQPEFPDVEVKRCVAGPAAEGIIPDAALYAMFTAVAVPFLAELGKDLYRVFREALFRAYQKAPKWANSRGYIPLVIEVGYENRPEVCFLFPPDMNLAEFELAIKEMSRLYSDIDRQTDEPQFPVQMGWDGNLGTWKRSEVIF